MAKKNDKALESDAGGRVRVIVAGPADWRDQASAAVRKDGRFDIVDSLEADLNGVDAALVSDADVLIGTVDPAFPAPAVDLMVALQKKIHALAVVVVLPAMYRDELEALERFRDAWSLVPSDAVEDERDLAEVVWSASRGMRWVNPAMRRRLDEVKAVTRRRSVPVAEFNDGPAGV